MQEARETRLKRLAIRSMRRGTREMDLILSRFAGGLGTASDSELDAYERLLEENDNDLFLWVTGAQPEPEAHRLILERIRAALA